MFQIIHLKVNQRRYRPCFHFSAQQESTVEPNTVLPPWGCAQLLYKKNALDEHLIFKKNNVLVRSLCGKSKRTSWYRSINSAQAVCCYGQGPNFETLI